MSSSHSLKIALVAGEISGDALGADLINALKKTSLSFEFTGIGGPQMQQAGLLNTVPFEHLNVMGITDVLKQYPKLFFIRQQLYKKWIQSPPDVFIGIDYPEFNLSLAAKLKKKGIKTVHLVSPKIWAWRQKRIFFIKKAVDLMLTLFPFEEVLYQKHDVPVQYVGHPLADQIEFKIDAAEVRKKLGYTDEDEIIAVMPGSRKGELKYMAPLFLDVMHAISLKRPKAHFIIPIAHKSLRKKVEYHIFKKAYNLQLQIVNESSHKAIIAANLVLAKSGTSTLEATLLKRPMVVAFKCSRITYALVAPLVKIPFISLPNILSQQYLVPEFIQKNASASSITKQIIKMLSSPTDNYVIQQFESIHQVLHQNSSEKSALAILRLLGLHDS